jgi:hypothetical protein
MAEVSGIAHDVRLDEEGNDVVLRFVLHAEGGERIPVEMRGRKVLGVLNSGNRVRLSTRGSSVRGRGRVARPTVVHNIDTASEIRVRGEGCFTQLFELVGSLLMSVVSGLIIAWLSTFCGLIAINQTVEYSFEEAPEAAMSEPTIAIVPILIGLGVAVLVFFLIYIRPRLRRT